MFWSWLGQVLVGPLLQSALDAYKAKIAAGNTSEQIAADLAAKELQLQNQLQIAEIGHPWEPEKLAFYVVLLYFAKCVVWDTMLGWGSTPLLKGDVSTWAGMVMGFYFSKRTVENAIRIFKR